MPRRSQARRWRDVVVEDEGRVRVNGAELYYEVGGVGQPSCYSTTASSIAACGTISSWPSRTFTGPSATTGGGTAIRPLQTDRSPRCRTYITCFATWASTKLTFWACPTAAR